MIGKNKKIFRIALWVITVPEMLMMALAGSSKFMNPTLWQGMFVDWGYPIWFTSVIGITEIVSALLLLVPAVAFYSGSVLIVVMLGALSTVLIHNSQLGPVMPVIHLTLLSFVLFGRYERRWKPGRKAVSTASPAEA